MRIRSSLLLAALLSLTGCATTSVPEPIREPPPSDISLSEVRANPTAFKGSRVRWGGTIAGVENRPQETWIDVVARPLDSSGRPRPGSESQGRFTARVQGFLDPAVYQKGRQVTVAGTVEDSVTKRIGEYPYLYVVMNAETTQLWEPLPERRAYYRDPFYGPFYDPFYDPFWRARLHPWYGPHPYYPYW